MKTITSESYKTMNLYFRFHEFLELRNQICL